MRRAHVVAALALLMAQSCTATVQNTPSTASSAPPTSTAPATTTASATVATPPVSPSTSVAAARLNEQFDATTLARELTLVERAALRGDGTVGVREQLLYRYLSGHAEMDSAVLAAVGSDVRPTVERIVAAREFGQARAAANPSPSAPPTTLPAWTIVEPLPVDQLLSEYRGAEHATGIAWYWLAAIHLQETRMGRIVGVSSAGAVGPMQFLPSTWAQCCTGDPTIAHDAILGAATYLAQNGGPANMDAALHAYNPNETYVHTVTAFAENLRDDPDLFASYHQWQVFYSTAAGTVRLPVGFSAAQPIDATGYLHDHPEDGAS